MRENVFLRDTALDNIDPNDGRRIEVVVSGLPIARGIPIAVDATLVSPLHADGTPHPHTVTRPGASSRRAEASKANTYPELVNSSLLQLLTVASETGGRLNRTGCKLLEDVAAVRARAEPAVLQSAAARAWRNRWTTLLSVCVQDALAATLVDDGSNWLETDGPAPLGVEVWLSARGEPATTSSTAASSHLDFATAAADFATAAASASAPAPRSCESPRPGLVVEA